MKAIKKIWDVVSTLVVILAVVLAVALVGVRLVGFQVFTVLSGSMEPVYSPGDLIYVKDVAPEDITEGTIITFMVSEDTVATHRVVGMVQDETDPDLVRYRTKGDANDAEDGTLVHPNNILGTPKFSIPKLGYVANYIQHPPGTYVAVSVVAIFVALMFLPDLFADEEADGEEQPKKKSKRSKKES